MEKQSKILYLVVFIALNVLILDGYFLYHHMRPHKETRAEPAATSGNGKVPFTAGPATIAGIVIDQTGKRITAPPGFTVAVTDNNKLPFQITLPNANDDYQYSAYLANPALPYNVQCSNNTGSYFYSLFSATPPPDPARLVVILQNSAAPAPALEIVFLSSTPTTTLPANITVNLTTSTTGASLPTETFATKAKYIDPVTGLTTPAMDLATFSGITPGASYSFSFTNAAGAKITTPFTAPSPMSASSTEGFTFTYQ